MLLFSRVGIAREILTDQGSCFMSRVLKGLLSLLQVRQLQTLVYHPQTNGLVERFNKTLKQMLRRSWTSMGRTGTSSCPTCCSPFAKYPKHRQAFPPSNFCTGEGQGDSSTSPRRPGRVDPPPIAQWWTTSNRCETAWPRFGLSSENIRGQGSPTTHIPTGRPYTHDGVPGQVAGALRGGRQGRRSKLPGKTARKTQTHPTISYQPIETVAE